MNNIREITLTLKPVTKTLYTGDEVSSIYIEGCMMFENRDPEYIVASYIEEFPKTEDGFISLMRMIWRGHERKQARLDE